MQWVASTKAKAIVFREWRAETARVRRTQLEMENAQLMRSVSRRGNSIWDMRKDDLVATAVMEAGMAEADARALTVIELRAIIRSHREVNAPENPLKGISKWNKAQLQAKAEELGIPLTRTKPNGQEVAKSNGDLILHIKAAVLGPSEEWTDVPMDQSQPQES